LDASGGSVFLNVLGAAQGALIRAAASTQTLCPSICFGVELNEFVPIKNSVSQTSDFGNRSVLGCYFSSGVLRRERLPATSQI
jgi:hypothetical protein